MLVKELVWLEEKRCGGEDTLFYVWTPEGRLSVLDRLTGYGFGIRDIESGYKDTNGKFWLASSDFDIRHFSELSIQDAIELIKRNANTCIGV